MAPKEDEAVIGNIEEFKKRFFPEASKPDTIDESLSNPETFGASLAVSSLAKFSTLLQIAQR